MTGLLDLDAFELRCELEAAVEAVLKLNVEFMEIDPTDALHVAVLKVKLDPWLHRVRQIRNAQRLQAAA